LRKYIIWYDSFTLAPAACVSIIFWNVCTSSTRKIEVPIAPDALVPVYKERAHRIPQDGNLNSYFSRDPKSVRLLQKITLISIWSQW